MTKINIYPELSNGIPFIAVTYNRKEFLASLLAWTHKQQALLDLVIVDMGSTYPPMIEALAHVDCRVIYSQENIGPRGLWFSDYLSELVSDGPFVIADGDIDYSKTSLGLLPKLASLMAKYPGIAKAGPALKLSDLPKSEFSEHIRATEAIYWDRIRQVERDVFLSPIDTTPALYRKWERRFCFEPALRVAGNYEVRHGPWYEDSNQLTDEQLHYRVTQRRDISTGGGRFSELPTKQKLKSRFALKMEVEIIKKFPRTGSRFASRILRSRSITTPK